MDTQVKVTLASLNGDLLPSERIFYLNPDRCMIPIGRASKSASKGLLGAGDNAWFDSPVMSRHHAQMTFDAENKNIVIEDIGSMHGTFLNNVPLPSKTAMVIGNGDEVKFGAEVRRGPEMFPACRFQINYEFVPYRPGNTFEVPQFSDAEEEEEDEYDSGNDSDRQGQPSSEDGVSIESPVPCISKAAGPIDLTKDDSPAPRNTFIDLTDDTPAERRIINIMAEGPANINGVANPVSIAFAGNYPVLDDDVHFSSDSEDQLKVADSSDSDSSEEGFGMEQPEGSVSSDDEEAIENYPERASSSELEGNGDMTETSNPVENIYRFSIATNDNPVVPLSDPLLRDEPGIDEEADEMDFGLAEAGAEGIRALYEGGLLQSPTCYSIPSIHGRHDSYGASSTSGTGATAEVLLKNSSDSSATESTHGQATTISGQTYLPPLRQPSPSDAAMVKTGVTTTKLPAPMTVKSLDPKKPGMLFRPHLEQSSLGSDGSEQSLGPVNAKRFTEPSSAVQALQVKPSFDLINSQPSTDSAMPIRDECPFLDRPDTAPITARVASPLPDMTSAVSYTASKESMAAATKPAPKQSMLKIPEMCDRSPSPSVSLKRKACEISIGTEEGNRTSNTSHSITKAAKISGASSVLPIVSGFAARLDGPRPTKRFRRIMENVGYAAIGGVAVGATLFTALVATAPNFS